MDGYHLTRAQLSAMPNPAVAHARRGAAFTFDGDSFVQLVRQLKADEPLTDTTPTVFAPSFDHAVKDPKEGDIRIERTHRIVVLEGNCELTNPNPNPNPHPFLLFLPLSPSSSVGSYVKLTY